MMCEVYDESYEVVGEMVERSRGCMILQLARESIAEARVAAHRGADGPVLTFHE